MGEGRGKRVAFGRVSEFDDDGLIGKYLRLWGKVWKRLKVPSEVAGAIQVASIIAEVRHDQRMALIREEKGPMASPRQAVFIKNLCAELGVVVPEGLSKREAGIVIDLLLCCRGKKEGKIPKIGQKPQERQERNCRF